MDWNMWPQFVVAGIFLLSIGIGMENHGKPKTGNNSIVVDLISVSLTAWLLYMGGFWS